MNNIKSKQGKEYFVLSLLLCLFFSCSVSAQLFTKDNASLFISENTLVCQKLKQNEKVVLETRVYVVNGTILTNLRQSSDIQIAYVENRSSKNNTTANKNNRAKQRILNSLKEETNTKKYCYSKIEDESRTSIHKSQNSCINASSSSNGNKFSANIIRNSFQNQYFYLGKHTIRIDDDATLKTSFNVSFSIRPPPYL